MINNPSLTELGKMYGTDKIGSHTYLPIYEQYFDPIRDKKIRLLEIGYGGYANPDAGGESARMFADYFSEGEIVVTDIYPKNLKPNDRFIFKQGSQTDLLLMQGLGNFDIVIDDGSHNSSDVIISFCGLFPLLNDGGIYIVEDTQTSYWPECSPNMKSMEYFKSLCDGLNYNEVRRQGYQPTYFDQNIFAIHFYHNLIIVLKGDNTEPSNVVHNG